MTKLSISSIYHRYYDKKYSYKMAMDNADALFSLELLQIVAKVPFYEQSEWYLGWIRNNSKEVRYDAQTSGVLSLYICSITHLVSEANS